MASRLLRVGRSNARWGEDLMGEMGHSAVGAVVGDVPGAGCGGDVPHLFPASGYGGPGGDGPVPAGCFDGRGRGAVVNASRSLICAHKAGTEDFVPPPGRRPL